MRHKLYILTLLIIAVCGCRRVKPQSPANRPSIDSLGLAITMVNLRMAEEADLTCTKYAQTCDSTFVLSEDGYWYHIIRNGDTSLSEALKEGMVVELHYCTYKLNGQLIEDTQQQIRIGKRETLFALDKLLPVLHEDEQAQLICPYYTAYGIEANNQVDFYTNCIIHLNKIQIIEHTK